MHLDHSEFLKDVGLGGLPPDQQAGYLEALVEQLGAAILEALAAELDDELLDEWAVVASGPADIALIYLQINLANFYEIVREVVARFKENVAARAPEIVALEAALAASAVPATESTQPISNNEGD